MPTSKTKPRIKAPEIVQKAPEERFVEALTNISSADKVVLKNVRKNGVYEEI